MDRASLLNDLVQAERQMVFARRQVDNQHRLIAQLEEQGRDAAESIELLKQFIEAQELWERERDRLVTKLATVR